MTIIPFPSGAIPAPATGREPHTPVDSFAARPLPDDDEPCPGCGDGGNVPATGYWRCPVCDAEWPEETGDPPATPTPTPTTPPSCTVCNGEGVVWYDRAPDPRLAWGEFECSRCNGDGYEPEGPCGQHCFCWYQLEKNPDGEVVRGLCVKDEEPEPIRANVDYSAWREWLR